MKSKNVNTNGQLKSKLIRCQINGNLLATELKHTREKLIKALVQVSKYQAKFGELGDSDEDEDENWMGEPSEHLVHENSCVSYEDAILELQTNPDLVHENSFVSYEDAILELQTNPDLSEWNNDQFVEFFDKTCGKNKEPFKPNVFVLLTEPRCLDEILDEHKHRYNISSYAAYYIFMWDYTQKKLFLNTEIQGRCVSCMKLDDACTVCTGTDEGRLLYKNRRVKNHREHDGVPVRRLYNSYCAKCGHYEGDAQCRCSRCRK